MKMMKMFVCEKVVAQIEANNLELSQSRKEAVVQSRQLCCYRVDLPAANSSDHINLC